MTAIFQAEYLPACSRRHPPLSPPHSAPQPSVTGGRVWGALSLTYPDRPRPLTGQPRPSPLAPPAPDSRRQRTDTASLRSPISSLRGPGHRQIDREDHAHRAGAGRQAPVTRAGRGEDQHQTGPPASRHVVNVDR